MARRSPRASHRLRFRRAHLSRRIHRSLLGIRIHRDSRSPRSPSERMEPAAQPVQAPGGVNGELDGVPVVFFRRAHGLALRVGDRLIDLEVRL